MSAEGLVWAHWGPEFQKLLDKEGVTIDQVISPSNRVNSWDWMMKPFYPTPLRTQDGDHYQLLRFAGRSSQTPYYFQRMNGTDPTGATARRCPSCASGATH